MIRPSQCQDCTPSETHQADTEHAWTVELAHQAECPSHPNRRTDS